MIAFYLFKTKNLIEGATFTEQQEQDENCERNEVQKAVERLRKRLTKCNDDSEYDATYKRGINRLADYFMFPEQMIRSLGYTIDSKTGKKSVKVKTIEQFDKVTKVIISKMHAKCEGVAEVEYSMIEALTPYFKDGKIILTKDVTELLIADCMTCISKKTKAKEIFPSDNSLYDSEYVSKVRKFARVLRKANTLMDKKYVAYGVLVDLSLEVFA